MSEDLLSYFNREIGWFRNALGRFADAHPQAGANLRISDNLVEDPHVSRLIESVALLNARVQSRIDDDFPLIVQSLLENLYPFYLAPKPSMMISQLTGLPELDSLVNVPAGTLFETESVSGVRCRFRSCYDAVLSPLRIASASLMSRPFSTPGSDSAVGASAVLEIRFESAHPGFSLAESGMDELTLHLRGGALTWRLFDLLYAHCTQIVVATSDLDPQPTRLEPVALRPLGLAPGETILPDLGDTAPDYQQLLEFFAYPDKFLFFRIDGLRRALGSAGSEFALYLYLDEGNAELEKTLGAGFFALHSVPMLNLFPAVAEPCRVRTDAAEYPVTPDIRSLGDAEVYAVTGVDLVEDGSNAQQHVAPYFSFDHEPQPQGLFWQGHRRAALAESGGRRGVTDYLLTLSQLDARPPESDRHTLQVRCLCSNANLAANLPFGGGSPRLDPEEPISGLDVAVALTPPTPVRRLNLGNELLWRLISHLNLNYLSLVGARDPGAQLREILRLYDFGDSPATRSIIRSVDSLRSCVASLPVTVDGRPVVCRGIDMEVVFDPSLLETSSALLLGDTLQRFLTLYVSLNSFVRLTARIKGRDGVYHRWEPLIGRRVLL